ncbi:MAG: 50S ribosomal protein L22 [Alphaproteobacteria bacterium]|nr:50S ribosomal protein L22 [Alphaproteobacteria bacterium]NCB49995.1 50S ribosomal protein L22 [Alphaproteobacteria bacterium]
MVEKLKKEEKVSVKAIDRAIRCSPQKLNIVATMIRGMGVSRAISELSFSKRRVATHVKKVLLSAIANAENNHSLDVDRLYVAEAYVGKSMVMKRYKPMAKGRAGHVQKPFSNLTVVVREQEEKA